MSNKSLKNAKRAAYAQKQEEQGKKVINWIFAILVLLGAIYALFTIFALG